MNLLHQLIPRCLLVYYWTSRSPKGQWRALEQPGVVSHPANVRQSQLV